MGSLFSFISNPFEVWLAHLAVAVGSAGVAIILFTIIIRLILSPLQVIQLRSARAMQKLQPEIAELRRKHGKDKQKMTEETMRLYREHKVNPAMGCLPMLLQFPVLIGLFWALRGLGSTPTKHGHAIPVTAAWLKASYHNFSPQVYTLFHAHFLWLDKGLGAPDPLFILPILAGLTQLVQSRMMMQQTNDPQQQSMNMIMNFTPLIIVVIALRYPSGLSLYWVTSTLMGILVSIPITGWGTLPRIDRMLFGGGTAPVRTPVKPKAPSRQAKPPELADIAGKDETGADIVLADGNVDEEPEDGGTPPNGQSAPTSRSRRQPGRRRTGRPRGGRRG